MASEQLELQSEASPNYGTADQAAIVNSENSALEEKGDEKESRKRRLIHGMLLCLLYSIAIAFSVPCLQMLGPVSVSSMEVLFIAYAAHGLCSIPVWLIGWSHVISLSNEESRWLLLAATANGTATAFFYLAAEVLPSGVIGALEEGSFLLFSVLVTWYLDQRMSVILLISAVTCLCGLILFAISSVVIDPLQHQRRHAHFSPGMLTKGTDLTKAVLYDFHPSMSYLLLFLAAVLLVIANLIVNRKLERTTSLVKLLVFFPVMGILCSLLITYCFTQPQWHFDISEPDHYLPFIGFIILFVISATSLYGAWIRTPAPIFGLISTGSLVLYMIIHYTIPVPGIDPGTPDALEFVGASLILIANIIGPLGELGMCPGQHWFDDQVKGATESPKNQLN